MKEKIRINTWVFHGITVLFLASILYGWSIRDEGFISADEGLGYALGIIGGVLMLSQLFYTMRKNMRSMQTMGSLRHWLNAHMLVGTVAPVLIFYHASFQLGSLNSTVALFSMILVATSGLVGRYLYIKIHRGLHGRKLTLKEHKENLDEGKYQLLKDIAIFPDIKEMVDRFEEKTLITQHGLLHILKQLLLLGGRVRQVRRKTLKTIRKDISMQGQQEGWSKQETTRVIRLVQEHTRTYVRRVQRIVEFESFSRIFSLWHVLHIPLFTLLVVTGIVHVFAVHIY